MAGGRCDGAVEGGSVPAEFWFPGASAQCAVRTSRLPLFLITNFPTSRPLIQHLLEPQLLANRTASRPGKVLFGLCSKLFLPSRL